MRATCYLPEATGPIWMVQFWCLMEFNCFQEYLGNELYLISGRWFSLVLGKPLSMGGKLDTELNLPKLSLPRGQSLEYIYYINMVMHYSYQYQLLPFDITKIEICSRDLKGTNSTFKK